jgi:hypothetical protein
MSSFDPPPPPPAGVVHAPCPFRYFVATFGGVGTAPPVVAVIGGI